MKRKNRFVHRSKISEKRFRTFLRWFAAGLTTRIIARRTKLNRNTINKLSLQLRERMAEDCAESNSAVMRIRAGAAFWRYVRMRFLRIKRVHKHRAHLHLKECEWRYKHRKANMYTAMLALVRKRPLRYS